MTWALRILAMLLLATSAQAFDPDCEAMATLAGQQAGLPDGLLPAISRIESGRSMNGTRKAWPWTLNHAGKGLYFDTRAKALAYLRQATQSGRTNIDVGCMQVNHYWHGKNFASLEAMLDPKTNISYAVQFLQDLHQRHGSWTEAVKHYHSPDEARGARYFKGFEIAQRQMENAPAPVMVTGYGQTVGGGGFFGLGQIGAQRQDMGLLSTGSQDVDAMYDALIAALNKNDNADFAIWTAPQDMTPAEQTRGVVRERWDLVQVFRKELAGQ